MKFWGLVAICCLLCACSDDHAGNPEDDGHPSYSGMVYIAASGRMVDLGTDSPEASAKERPKANTSRSWAKGFRLQIPRILEILFL